MKASNIRLVQKNLSDSGLYPGIIDGKRGRETTKAVYAALAKRTSSLSDDWQSWSDKRHIVAYLQLLCHDKGIDSGQVDGYYGPSTESAVVQLKALLIYGAIPRGFADINPIQQNPHNFPLENINLLNEYYSKPCEVSLVKVPCPWTLRLDWNLRSTTKIIMIHEKLSDSLANILQQTYDVYGSSGIKELGLDHYGGSVNCRKKRGSMNSWSTHAWGISIDWFPSANKLSWNSQRASLAHPDLDAWWALWEQEGWLSLGRTEDRDWMHIQAAKRR